VALRTTRCYVRMGCCSLFARCCERTHWTQTYRLERVLSADDTDSVTPPQRHLFSAIPRDVFSRVCW
jgi:hypothetical protein